MRFALAKISVLPMLGVGVAMAPAAAAVSPYMQPDNSLVTLSGTVVSPDADSFELDYGSGTITVEMDDWDAYGDAHGLMDGDRVTVYGRIDDDFFETTTIEAGAVYVENLNSYFYASSADEESMAYSPHLWAAPAPVVVSRMTLSGEVTAINRDDGQFTVSVGSDDVIVETETLGYNPLDDKGYQQIGKGDWVSVSGDVDYELIDGRVLEASALTTLLDDSASS